MTGNPDQAEDHKAEKGNRPCRAVPSDAALKWTQNADLQDGQSGKTDDRVGNSSMVFEIDRMISKRRIKNVDIRQIGADDKRGGPKGCPSAQPGPGQYISHARMGQVFHQLPHSKLTWFSSLENV